MRLIDADRLMDALRGNVLIGVTSELEEAIAQQPTVFDKEKVIKELGRCRIYQFQGMLPDGRVCHFSDVIEIVKKGGIERNVVQTTAGVRQKSGSTSNAIMEV